MRNIVKKIKKFFKIAIRNSVDFIQAPKTNEEYSRIVNHDNNASNQIMIVMTWLETFFSSLIVKSCAMI